MKLIISILLISFCSLELLAQSRLQVASGTTVTSTDGAQVVLDDTDLDNDGVIEQSGDNGSFHFTGLQESLLSGKGINRFDRLVLSKSGSTTLLLSSDVTVTGKLQFITGRLNLKDNNIYLGNSGVLEGETELTNLFSTGRGYIESIREQNNALTINPGNLGAVISSGSNLGKIVIRRGHLSQLNTRTGNESILRYYDILPSNNSNINATVRFQYFDSESNQIDEADFSVLRASPASGWSDLGADGKSASSNFVEKKGITQFSRFTLSTPAPSGKLSYTVWPNPVLQNANISFSASVPGNMKIMVYDSHGELVQVQQAKVGVGINQVQVDMRKLPQGNYTLQTNWLGQTKISGLNKM
jgi:hypothetical protein